MGAKDIYFSMEEKWYNALDKVDAHIPIYNVIDKIDEVIPSFALFIITLVIILLLAGISLIAPVGGQQATLELMIVNNAGEGVSGAQVTFNGTDEVYYSNSFGVVEGVEVPLGATINLTVKKDDKKKTLPVKISELEQIEEIRLPIERIAFSSKTISFVNEYGMTITKPLTINYSCSSGEAPAEETTTDGLVLPKVSSECGTLTITVSSESFEEKQIIVTGNSKTITLTETIPSTTGTAYITLTYNGETISEPVEVKAYRSNNRYEAVETKTVSNGQATFTLPEGDYIFETKQGYDYGSNTSELVTITENESPTVEIELEKTILGKVHVVVKKGISRIEEATVTLRKGNSEIENNKTDNNGYTEFSVGEEGPFNLVVTKEGYCAAIEEADIGEEVEIRLESDTGSCGGELKIKVLDQDGKAIQYAKGIIFGETSEDSYKLGYKSKLTDYNGEATWEPVSHSEKGEKYRVFAYKGSYSGWSEAKEFTALNQGRFVVNLDIPDGTVKVNVKDKDDEPLQFAEVQLFEDYGNQKATGKKIISQADGTISFNVRSGQRVYAVVSKEGYETYTTLPKKIIGAGTINFDVTLSKPPVNELLVDFSGLFKNDKRVLKAQPGEEYTAVFEITAPKRYEELGFFVRVGKEKVSKTELDSLYIKEMVVPGKLVYNGSEYTTKGSSYNPPNGYDIDSEYLGLEESKWAQVVWDKSGYAIGKIKVGAKVKIKDNAKQNEQLEIAYRAFGYDNGYERDPEDVELGTTSGNSSKQSLYAHTKTAYAWIGTETLCEKQGDNSFCITSTITNNDGITTSFDDSFDAKNNAKYDLAIKVLNASTNFDITKIKLENNENNLFIGNYTLIKPNNAIVNGSVEGYETEWIENGAYARDTEFALSNLEITPTKAGFGTLLMRIRDQSSILFEKAFNVNIISSNEMKVNYMVGGEFVNEIPHIVSGKKQNFTLKAIDSENNLEINNARVKLYDRFGTKIDETITNKLGVAVLEIPASLPGEKLKINIEKEDYETKEIEFNVSEDIVTITPEKLSFTVNPQTKEEDRKTVKIENKTGFDLEIKEIELAGKFKGLLSESQIESWFNSFKGKTIKSNDYEEIDFKVVVGKMIPTAEDLSGVFRIIVGNSYNSWKKEIPAKIRVGLGQDVDTQDCLEATLTSWQETTQGGEVQVSFEIRNNCTVDGQPVQLSNLGAQIDSTGNTIGTLSAQSTTAYTELSKGYTRTFKTTVLEEEVVPVTVKFTPYGGASGQTSGTILFQAKNNTSSKDQILTTGLDYAINIMGSDCLVIGTDLIKISDEDGEGSFTVSNECTSEATFTIDSKLALSNKTFTLAPGSSKDVIVNRTDADLSGAYNNLVYSRVGNGKQELIGNVKAILEDEGSCFSLSRYEFDIYDSPYNDTDGTDRSYLRNSCIQKNVNVQVSGEENYDWDKLLRDMLVGGVSGLVFSKGKILPDWMSEWYDDLGDGGKRMADELANEDPNTNLQLVNANAAKIARLETAKKLAETDKKLKEFQKVVDLLKGKLDEKKSETEKPAGDDTKKEPEEPSEKVAEAGEKIEKDINNEKERLINTARNYTLNKDTIDKHLAIRSLYFYYNLKGINQGDKEVPKLKTQINNISREMHTKNKNAKKVLKHLNKKLNLTKAEEEAAEEEAKKAQNLKSQTTETIIKNLPEEVGGTGNNDQFNVEVSAPTTGSSGFLLATRTKESSGGGGRNNIGDAIFYNMINVAGGAFGGSAVGGALISGALSILQGQDLGVEYNETFTVPLVKIKDIAFESAKEIKMSVGETTYDYDDYYGSVSDNTSGQEGYLYNKNALNATLGLTELRELTFTGKEGLVNASPYHPFTGILTVIGKENVYKPEYDYQEVKEKGDGEEDKDFFEGIINPSEDLVYGIEEKDLEVKEVRTYNKKFHLLFNSYEYVECGPDTYPCPPTKIGNCQVGSKTGSTGVNAVPRMLLNWEWSNIDAELCDEKNPDYKYCDSTQATIATLKKVLYMKEFFNSNSLINCPQAIDIAGTKTQNLATDALDVGITSIRAEEIDEGAKIEVRVETNNNLEMGATVDFEITREDDSIVSNSCETEKRFTSNATYTCNINTSQMGTGKFNVKASLNLDLCEDCKNSNTENDSISNSIIIGSQGQQKCLEYRTTRTYFEKVLSANDVLDDKALDYIEFTINLVRDGFSEDFKNDLDAYLMQFLAAPPAYKDELKELFLSDKFSIDWPRKPQPWKAGKYNARLIIEFKEDSWQWNDNNDIKNITLKLEPWAEPSPNHTIYNVGFNGMVGINTDNGRNGYGINYSQLTEEPLVVVQSPNKVSSITNPLSNAVSKVNVSVDDSFYNINKTRKGNLLTISRTGDNISLIISPTVPVPLILDITRTQAMDAYGYYSVEVNGEPQLSGSSMLNWTGIGEGCVDFSGASMTNWVNSPDLREDSGTGYGLRWNNAIANGTASFYEVMYVPEDSIAKLEIIKSSEEASFESTHGSGDIVNVDHGQGISTIKEVFNAVEDERVCVIGGEYFWNNGEIINELIEEIRARENSCMTLTS